MKPESASAILSVTQESIGVTLTYESVFFLQMFTEGLGQILAPVKNASTIEEFMAAMPEIDPAEMEMVLAMVPQIPIAVRNFMVKSAEKAKRDFPIEKQGRPKSLTTENHRKIVAKVGSLHVKGVKLGAAMGRASKEFGVSVATVRRAWSKRGTLTDDPVTTVKEMWHELVSSLTAEAVALLSQRKQSAIQPSPHRSDVDAGPVSPQAISQ